MMSLVRVKLSLDLSCVKVSLAGRIAFCHRDNWLTPHVEQLAPVFMVPPLPAPPPSPGVQQLAPVLQAKHLLQLTRLHILHAG